MNKITQYISQYAENNRCNNDLIRKILSEIKEEDRPVSFMLTADECCYDNCKITDINDLDFQFITDQGCEFRISYDDLAKNFLFKIEQGYIIDIAR